MSGAHDPTTAPPGFVYEPDLVSPDEETALVEALAGLPFGEVRMRGMVARRRTAHFGWVYGYESWRIEPGPPIPDVLLPLRERAARMLGVPPGALAEVLVTEYPPGAGIGWHRDAAMFGEVAGISLLGPGRMRFERRNAGRRETRAVTLAPRSAYLLRGAARWQWRHSIPAVHARRCSITFRTLRNDPGGFAEAGRRRPPRPKKEGLLSRTDIILP